MSLGPILRIIGGAALNHLPRIVRWVGGIALFTGAGCEEGLRPLQPDGGVEKKPRPDTQVAPRGCEYQLTLHTEGLRYRTPFSDLPQTPSGPIDTCLMTTLVRTTLPADRKKDTITGLLRFASFPPFESDPRRGEACITPPEYNNYCEATKGFGENRVKGKGLNHQIWFVAAKSTASQLYGGSWGSFFQGLNLLTPPETEETGSILSVEGLFEFLNPDDPTEAWITFTLRSTAEDPNKPGGYLPLPLSGRVYLETFSLANDCLPIEGVQTLFKDLKIPSWEDGHGLLLLGALECRFENVKVTKIPGINYFPAVCCEGDACRPANGIGLDRIFGELEIECKEGDQ